MQATDISSGCFILVNSVFTYTTLLRVSRHDIFHMKVNDGQYKNAGILTNLQHTVHAHLAFETYTLLLKKATHFSHISMIYIVPCLYVQRL